MGIEELWMLNPYDPPSLSPKPPKKEPTTDWRDLAFISLIILLMLFGNVLITSLIRYLRATFS
jgi:hypothetical protein